MSFFRIDRTDAGDVFVPLDDASSKWNPTHLRGPAITALLARALEREAPSGVRPARLTFDLHSPVPMAPCQVRATTIKRGRTLALVESELIGEDPDRVLARCRGSFVVASEGAAGVDEPEGSVWAAPLPPECVPPAPELESISAQGRLYRSSSTPWSGTRTGHQNADRKLIWSFDEPIIEGELPTSLQRAARAADLGNFVINTGAQGLAHINTDVTLSLSRVPEPDGVGVCGELRSAGAEVSVGTAILFDRIGLCGFTTVTAVRHTKTHLNYAGTGTESVGAAGHRSGVDGSY